MQRIRFRSDGDAERAKAALAPLGYTELPGYELAVADEALDEALRALEAAGLTFRVEPVEGFVGGRALEEQRAEPAPPPWLFDDEDEW